MNKLIKNVGLSLATVLMGTMAFSQIKDGIVVYDMEMKSDNEQMQMQLDMMAGTTMSMTFVGESYKTDMQSPMMINKTIFNAKENKALSLMEMAGMKIATPMTAEELDEKNKKERGDMDEDVEVIETKETEEIAGYDCKKIIVKSDKGEVIMYVTKEIKPSAKNPQFSSDKFEGFPLKIITTNERGGQSMEVILTASSVKTKIKDKDPFSVEVPKGYVVKTPEEVEKMQRGMRGGN